MHKILLDPTRSISCLYAYLAFSYIKLWTLAYVTILSQFWSKQTLFFQYFNVRTFCYPNTKNVVLILAYVWTLGFPEKGFLALKHVGILCHVRFESFYVHWLVAVNICKNNTRRRYCQTLSVCSSLNVRNQGRNTYKIKFTMWDEEFRYEYALNADLNYRKVFAAITILNNNRKSAFKHVAFTSQTGLRGSSAVTKYSPHLTQTRTEEEANERPNTQSIFLLVILLLLL
jgi:hypothetical protein